MKLIRQPQPFVVAWAVIMIASISIFALVGMNMGVDFTGGTLLERGLPGEFTAADVREVLDTSHDADLGSSVIQPLEGERPGETVVIIRTGELTNDQITKIDVLLAEQFGGVENRRTEVVGPVVGSELVSKSVWALVLSSLAIVLYLTFRFEYRFGIAAVLGVTHDVLVVIAFLALFRTEIDTPFVAAILTVLGYSLNNTIVIFDRIRENLSLRKKEPFVEIADKSVRQSMTRTINTNVTTVLVLGALLVLGGPTIRDFTLTLLLGVLVGTVSSVFFAPSIWVALQRGPRQTAAKVRA